MAQEIDSIVNRISLHGGVESVLLFNNEGVCIKSYNIFDEEKIKTLSALCSALAFRAKSAVKDLTDGRLEMIRAASDHREYMFAFERDYIMLAIYKQIDIAAGK